MSKWNKSRYDIFHYDDKADRNEPCEVILHDGELTISYEADDGPGYTVYKGRETSPGHFELTAPDIQGYATLHRLPDADLLVGDWLEGGEKGMWRIELDDESIA